MSCNCKTIVQNFHGGEVGPISACTGPISTYQINGCGNNQVSFFGKYTMPPSGGTAGQVLQYPSTGGTQLVWASDDQVSGGTLTDNCTASTQTLVLDLQDGTKLTITGNSCTDFCNNAMSGITAHNVTGCTSTLTLAAPLGTILSGQTSACTDTFYVTTISGCPVSQTVTVNEATFTHQNLGVNTRKVDNRFVINTSGNGNIFDGSGYNDKKPAQVIYNLTEFSGSDATIALEVASSGSSTTGKRSMIFGLDANISGESFTNKYFGIASGDTDVSTGQWFNVHTDTGVVGVHTHGAQPVNKNFIHPFNEIPLLQVSANTQYPNRSPIPVGHLSVCSSGASVFTSLIQSCSPASGRTDRGNFISLGNNNMNNIGDPINADAYDSNGVVINGQASFSRGSGITFFDEYRFPQHIGNINDSLVVSAGTNQLAWGSNLFTYVTGGTLSATCNAALEEPYLEHITVTLERKDSDIWPDVVITGYTCDPYSACGRTFSAGTITACTDGGILTLGPNVLIQTDSGGNGGTLTACTIFANTISACTDNYTTINDYLQVGAKNRPLVIKTTGSTIQPGIRHAVNLGQGAVIQGKGPLYTTIAGGTGIEVLSGKNDSGVIIQPEVNFIGGGSSLFLEASTAGAILGGMQNQMKLSNYATIGGGAQNIVSGSSLAGVFSGQLNRISGSTHSTLAGGFNNQIKNSNYSLIGGGRGNMMTASTESAIIAGSVSEIFDSVNATIGGGNSNQISGATEGFIGGGGQNVIQDPTSSAIVGGQKNIITGPLSDYSFIGAGTAGIIENSNNSVIVVGDNNRVLDSKGGSIVGGFAGTIKSSPFSFIGTGEFNAAGTSNYGFVGTGRRNTITASSNNSAVVGGEFNVISASTNSGIVAGGATGVAPNLINDSSYSFMGAPNVVEIRDSRHVFVGSASDSKILSGSLYSMIINGVQNTVSASTAASILNGGFNLIESSQYGFIGSGQQHRISTGNTYTTILNGSGGTVTYNSSASTILNGYKNIISGSPESFIGNGDFNRIRSNGRKANAILLGDTNTIDVANNYNTILNGVSNLISGTGISFIGTATQSEIINNDYSFIGSGTKHKIHPNYHGVFSKDYNAIGGGETNIISGSTTSVIFGGKDQIIQSADWASILGGRANKIDIGAAYGVIVGGLQNFILPDGFGLNLYDFIGGGQKNVITGSNSSVIVGGIGNIEDSSTGTFIGGGASNTISGTSNYSTIVGGGWNIIGLGFKSNYSFIGGGQYNYISGSGFSNLVGGDTNRVWDSDKSSLVGGENNILSGGSHNFLGGGISNKLTGGNTVVPERNVLVGGNNNTLSNSEDSVLVGGNQSTIDSSNNAVIVGGGRQKVQADSHNSGILVGGTNTIWDSSINSGIVAGKNLGISGTSSYSMIGAGQHNYLSTTVNSGVFVGFTNRILNSTNSSITSGQFNLINPSNNAFLGGGDTNAIQNSNIATLVGGRGNRITTNSTGSFVGGGKWNSISGQSEFAVVVGGRNNEISGGTGSTIVGGFSNRIWTPNEVASDRNRFAFIGGGQSNIVVDGSDNAFIGGGTSNRISGATTSIIVGGNANGITASTNSFIGGGGQNVIYARETIDNYNFIGGGISNKITGNTFSFVGGGFGNWVINGDVGGDYHYNTVVGGLSNNLSGTTGSFIGGGQSNYISGTTNSSIVGGKKNRIETPYGGNFTSGGVKQESDFSVIGGGSLNIIQKAAHSSVIAGGRRNLIQNSGDTSVIGGGSGNTISNDTFATVIGGGIDNIVGSIMNSATIGGGKQNTITATTSNASTEATIGGGLQNLIWDSTAGTIAGGDSNTISASTTGTIGGGDLNIISGNSRYAAILGGQKNKLGELSSWSTMGGGFENYIWYYSEYAALLSGFRNKLYDNSDYSLLGGGYWNRVSASSYSVLVGGEYNFISGDTPTRSRRNFIGSGLENYIVGARSSSIVGGEQNYIYSGSNFSFIGGGKLNQIYQQRSVPGSLTNTLQAFIGGGSQNKISGGTDNTIVGGNLNTIWGDELTVNLNNESNYGFIGGGQSNIIRHDTAHSIIGGGDSNIIHSSDDGTIGGGHANFISGNTHASILGGADNEISDGSSYASIGGGSANLIIKDSQYSSIDGGSDNFIIGDSRYSSIGGGHDNKVLNNSDYSNIDGGSNNQIWQTNNSTIGGGNENLILGINSNAHALYSTIGGGDSNIIQSNTGFMIGATIGGGRDNRISGGTLYNTPLGKNTVGGGGDNSIGEYVTSTIGGGYRNAMVISTAGVNESWIANNTIGGGSGNTMTDGMSNSTIGGGIDNKMYNTYSPTGFHKPNNTIGGGRGNILSAGTVSNTIGGGRENSMWNTYRATIGGGQGNFIYSNNIAYGEFSYYGTIGGGHLNRIEKGTRETIGGGYGNRIIKGISSGTGNQTRSNVIAGGEDNAISSSTKYGAVVGGYQNYLNRAGASLIGGGRWNVISGWGSYHELGIEASAIVGGQGNLLFKTPLSIIGGGQRNQITGGTKNFIGGGLYNRISSHTESTLVGGYANQMQTDVIHTLYKRNFMGGGSENLLSASSTSVIVGGTENDVRRSEGTNILGGESNQIMWTTNSSIVGGLSNKIFPRYPAGTTTQRAIQSFIGGGLSNVISGGTTSSIVGGWGNVVNNQSWSILGGGYDNTMTGITMFNTLLGGTANRMRWTDGSNIVGGLANDISGGTENSVVGGHKNKLMGVYNSFVGGGSGNTIHQYYRPNTAGLQPYLSVEQNVHSFIGAGSNNTISGASHSFIGAGSGNTINPATTTGSTSHVDFISGYGYSGTGAYIGSGFDNLISGSNRSTIVNGFRNIIKGEPLSPDLKYRDWTSALFFGQPHVDNLISSGNHNRILDFGPQSKPLSYIPVRKSTIINGRFNTISGSNMSFIGTGMENRIHGLLGMYGNNAILHGSGNTINYGTYRSTILGGLENEIVRVKEGAGTFGNPVFGGLNVVQSHQNFIGHGYQNTISGVTYGTILNGETNSLTWGGDVNGGTISSNYAILNGASNTIGSLGWFKPLVGDMRYSQIVGGNVNEIRGYSRNATIGGGERNSILGAGGNEFGAANILSPNNQLTGATSEFGAYNSMIGAGYGNTISGHTFIANSFIGAGAYNHIWRSPHSLIGSGYWNRILASPVSENFTGASASTIVGGMRNWISGETIASSIVGGEQNRILQLGTNGDTLPYSGRSSKGHYSFIGGGFKNKISGSSWSSIVGGSGNTITGFTKTTGLAVNAAYSFIGGGSGSTIGGASGATILGGARNEILPFAIHSHILGGTGNTVLGTATSSAILGCNDLTASIPNTTYMCALTASTISAQSFCLVNDTGLVGCLTPNLWTGSTQLGNAAILSATTAPDPNGFARAGINTDQPASMLTFGNNTVGVGGNYNSITWSGGTIKLGLQAGWQEGILNKVPQAEHNNVWIGWQSGYNNDRGGDNVGIGTKSLYNLNGLSSASGNTAIGSHTLYNTTNGLYNVAMGQQAGFGNTTGAFNVFIGQAAGPTDTMTANTAIAIGWQAMSDGNDMSAGIAGGEHAIAIGQHALRYLAISDSTHTSVPGVIGIGHEAFQQLKGSVNSVMGNIGIGESVGKQLGKNGTIYNGDVETNIGMNIMMGHFAGADMERGEENVLIGGNVASNQTYVDQSVIIGKEAASMLNGWGVNNTSLNQRSSTKNVTIGYQAAYSGNGQGNVSLGYQTAYSNFSGVQNTFIGYRTAHNLSGGTNIMALGTLSGRFYNTFKSEKGYGTEEIFIGKKSNYFGGRNSGTTSIGTYSAYKATGLTSSVVIGQESAWKATNHNSTILIGEKAGWSASTHTDSIGIGKKAFFSSTTSSHDIAIGEESSQITKDTNYNVSIGYQSGRLMTGTTNTVNIGTGAGREGFNWYVGTLVGNPFTLDFEYPQGVQPGLGSDMVNVGTNAGLRNTQYNTINIGLGAGLYGRWGQTEGNKWRESGDNINIGTNSGQQSFGGHNIRLGSRVHWSGGWSTHIIAMGYEALYSGTTLENTIAIGRESGYYLHGNGNSGNVSGGSVYMGYRSGYNLTGDTTGKGNVVIGDKALASTGGQIGKEGEKASDYISPHSAVAIGASAGELNAYGNTEIVAVGYQAMYNAPQSNDTVAIGSQAAAYANESKQGVYVGKFAGWSDKEAQLNIGIGYLSKNQHTGTWSSSSNQSNVAVGAYSQYASHHHSSKNVTGNVSIGVMSHMNIGATQDNVAIGNMSSSYFGSKTSYSNFTRGNVAVGYQTMYTANTMISSIAIGDGAGYSGQNSYHDIMIGYKAAHQGGLWQPENAVVNGENIGIGKEVMYYASGSTEMVVIGKQAGYEMGQPYGFGALNSGHSKAWKPNQTSVVIGSEAGYNLRGADNDIIIGTRAGYSAQTSNGRNIFMGLQSGEFAQGKLMYQNVAIGTYALKSATTNTNDSIAIGTYAGFSGLNNFDIALGYQSMYGRNAGESDGSVTRGGSIAIGLYAMRNQTGDTSNLSGYYHGPSIAIGNHTDKQAWGYFTGPGQNIGTTGFATQGGRSNLTIGNYALYKTSQASGGNTVMGGVAPMAGLIRSDENNFLITRSLFESNAKTVLYDSDRNVAVGANIFSNQSAEPWHSGFTENIVLGNNQILWGSYALSNNKWNIAIGKEGIKPADGLSSALQYNIAVGFQAMRAAVGDNNISIGSKNNNSLIGSTLAKDGENNIAIGRENQYYQGSNLEHNISIGYQNNYKLFDEGQKNVSIGYENMYSAQTPTENVAIGSKNLYSANTSTYNVALGYESLYQGNEATKNIVAGYRVARQGTGMTHCIVLGVDAATYMSGYQAPNNTHKLKAKIPMNRDIAMGLHAAQYYRNTKTYDSGSYNISIGYRAAFSAQGQYETINIGSQAGAYASPGMGGAQHIRIGEQAGYSGSGYHNSNVIIGERAGFLGGGNHSIMIGSQALGALTGNPSSTVGVSVGTYSSGNVGIGHKAGSWAKSGASNVFIGLEAGLIETASQVGSFQSGTDNIYIGRNTRAGNGPGGNIGVGLHNEIVIGTGLVGKGPNTTFIGGAAIYNAPNNGSWDTVSDERLKKNIVNSPKGLEEIYKLQVRNFEWREDHEIEGGLSKDEGLKTGETNTGFIAQEVKEVFPEAIKEGVSGKLTVNTDPIIFASIKAIQELKDEIESLKSEIKELKKNK